MFMHDAACALTNLRMHTCTRSPSKDRASHSQAEALGDSWSEVDEMEAQLAEELGISVDELEGYLDGDLDDLVEGLDEIEAAALRAESSGPPAYDIL